MKKTWKLDLAVLPNRLGERVETQLTAPAVEGLGNEFARVKESDALPLDIVMTSLNDGILLEVSGRVEAREQCVRCLDEFDEDIDFGFQEMLFTPAALVALTGGDNGAQDQDGDDEEGEPQGSFEMTVMREIPADNIFDLEELVRDEIGIRLPFRPLCEDDCPGLCPQCGFVMREDPDHFHEVIDDRWSALLNLRDQLEQGKDGKEKN